MGRRTDDTARPHTDGCAHTRARAHTDAQIKERNAARRAHTHGRVQHAAHSAHGGDAGTRAHTGGQVGTQRTHCSDLNARRAGAHGAQSPARTYTHTCDRIAYARGHARSPTLPHIAGSNTRSMPTRSNNRSSGCRVNERANGRGGRVFSSEQLSTPAAEAAEAEA